MLGVCEQVIGTVIRGDFFITHDSHTDDRACLDLDLVSENLGNGLADFEPGVGLTVPGLDIGPVDDLDDLRERFGCIVGNWLMDDDLAYLSFGVIVGVDFDFDF